MRFVSNVPIYLQIRDFYKKLIDSNVLRFGEYLPSVREVSISMNVNPNTVQKAFSLLIEEKYIESVVGKGNLIIKESQDNRENHLKEELKKLLDSGFSKDEIIDVLNKMES